MVLSMEHEWHNVHKILLIYTVFIYNVSVRNVLCGGRIVNRRIKVLAETGGAVSALTPCEHTVLCQQRCWQQAAARYVSTVLLVPKGERMSLVDIAILILKLIVAALQLLDAVLKYVK